MTDARYDGHADWYDETFSYLADGASSAGLLARLLGPARLEGLPCLDVGCGTGLHFDVVRAHGYAVIGVELSADQLRVARARCRDLVQADASRLPFADGSFETVVMTFTHTDVDEFATVVAEAARMLRPGGKLLYLGLHPCYVGGFLDRAEELESRQLRLVGGYGDETLHFDATGRFPVRSRVGSRNLTLTTFLGAFLSQETLRLETVQEYDTSCRPWQPDSPDGRLVPWNIAVTARAVASADGSR
jgi:SAM-dependent methyltransferase